MPDTQVILRNRRQQPVELHLPSGVLVLPPGGQAQVAESALVTSQLALLLARKVLDTRPVPAAAPAAAAAGKTGHKGMAPPKENASATRKAATRAAQAKRRGMKS